MTHVLITGAGGHLGRKLFDTLEADPAYSVSGVDIRAVDHPNIHTADLSGDPDWKKLLKDVDVIVHLAGDREPAATWSSAITHNMDATLTLYHQAAAMKVKRVVVASSNWVMFLSCKIAERTSPNLVTLSLSFISRMSGSDILTFA